MIINAMKASFDENIEINKLNFSNTTEEKRCTNKLNVNEASKSPRKDTKVEQLIEFLFNHFSKGVKFIGPFFAFALLTFVLVVSHSFFTILLPYWKKKLGFIFAILIILVCLFLLFNILFNYFLAVLVKPGSTKDIKGSRLYKRKNPYEFSELIKYDIKLDNILSEKKEVDANDIPRLKFCVYCNETKPLRAHHCQICGICVFKMDHHCPWIDNCVGQNNQRYFVLFLTHTLIGCIFINILSCPIFFFQAETNLPMQFNFVCILCLSGMILLLFFSSWNWFLVLNGNTTIEFWTERAGMNSNIITNFSLGEISENIYMIFGTKSIFQVIFLPSIKMLPFSGLEWSRLVDPNFKLEERNSMITSSDYDHLINEPNNMVEI
jgi:hypothetical protein